MQQTIRYFDKATLIHANDEAIRTERNRSINPQYLQTLDDALRFPVFMAMVHNDVEMRVGIMLSPDDRAWLDLSFEDYEALPSVDMAIH